MSNVVVKIETDVESKREEILSGNFWMPVSGVFSKGELRQIMGKRK